MKAADELMNDETSKLHDAISATAVNKQTVNVATMMLDTAKTKQDQAMQSLEKTRTKEKTDRQTSQTVRKGHVLNSECCQKKSKAKVIKCSKVEVGSYCKEDIHLVTVNFDVVLVCQKFLVAYHSHSFKGPVT